MQMNYSVAFSFGVTEKRNCVSLPTLPRCDFPERSRPPLAARCTKQCPLCPVSNVGLFLVPSAWYASGLQTKRVLRVATWRGFVNSLTPGKPWLGPFVQVIDSPQNEFPRLLSQVPKTVYAATGARVA